MCLTGNSSGQPPSGISGTGWLVGPPELNRSLGGCGVGDAEANSALRPANRSKNDLLLCSLDLATPLPSLMLCRSFISGSLRGISPRRRPSERRNPREQRRRKKESYSAECVEGAFSEVRLTAYYCGTTATASISTKKSGCARAETNTPVMAGGLGTSGQAFSNAAKPACSGCPSTI